MNDTLNAPSGDAIASTNTLDIVDATLPGNNLDNKVDGDATTDSNVGQPKELSAAEELDKLRRAKARDDRRIGKLTALKYQAQKEADDYRAQLSKYQASQQGQQAKASMVNGVAPTLPNGEPNPDAYTQYHEYMRDVAKYDRQQENAANESKQKETLNSVKEQAWENERLGAAQKAAEPFAKSIPDFHEVLNEYDDVINELPKDLKHAFLAADNTLLALYNLAKDGKLEDLASMSLVDAKVEIRLAQMKQPPKPQSKAPAPLPASRGSVAPNNFSNLSAKEQIKALGL